MPHYTALARLRRLALDDEPPTTPHALLRHFEGHEREIVAPAGVARPCFDRADDGTERGVERSRV